MTQDELISSCADAIKAFQAFRDQFSDDAWDALQEQSKHTENLLDALCELEYQVEHQLTATTGASVPASTQEVA